MPTKTQQELLAKHFGCTRYLYNHFLARRKEQYLTTGRSNNFVRDCKELTELKKTLTWLTEVNSQSLQHVIKNLDAAYGNFFEKRAKFPTFKNKHGKQTFRIPQNVRIKNGKLVVPKFLEGIPMVLHQEVPEEISYCTITKNKAGQYHCTLLVEKYIEQLPENDKVVGVDLGINNLATTSEGEIHSGSRVDNVRRRCGRARKTFQRTGTKSAKKRLKKLAGRQSRFQKDINHQISKQIVLKAKALGFGIGLENLSGIRSRTEKTVRRKQRSRHSNWSFFQLHTFISYKAQLAGVPVIFVDPSYTSQTCNRCGHCEKTNRAGSQFKCQSCKYACHADFNGAVNIASRAKSQFALLSNQVAKPPELQSRHL